MLSMLLSLFPSIVLLSSGVSGIDGVNYWFSFGDSYTQTGFVTNGTLPTPGNPLGNPTYPVSLFIRDYLVTPILYRDKQPLAVRTGSMWIRLSITILWFLPIIMRTGELPSILPSSHLISLLSSLSRTKSTSSWILLQASPPQRHGQVQIPCSPSGLA